MTTDHISFSVPYPPPTTDSATYVREVDEAEYGAALPQVHRGSGRTMISRGVPGTGAPRRDGFGCTICHAPPGEPCRGYTPAQRRAGLPPPYGDSDEIYDQIDPFSIADMPVWWRE